MTEVKVISYDARFLNSYIELNREWIERYFEIEPMDILQLEDPQKYILNVGGEIFFVLNGEEAVGTCAMVPHGKDCFELAKMAVSPSKRGRGYGDLVIRAAINWARERDTQRVILLSNTRLEPAIELYKKHGFKTTHLGTHPDYKRCNITMELQLN